MIKEFAKNEIIALYKEGVPISQITKKTGVKSVTIWRIAKDSGIEMRKANAPRRFDDERVVKLYLDKENTVKDIMCKTGIKSEQTIYAILKRNGIQLRKRKFVKVSDLIYDEDSGDFISLRQLVAEEIAKEEAANIYGINE